MRTCVSTIPTCSWPTAYQHDRVISFCSDAYIFIQCVQTFVGCGYFINIIFCRYLRYSMLRMYSILAQDRWLHCQDFYMYWDLYCFLSVFLMLTQYFNSSSIHISDMTMLCLNKHRCSTINARDFVLDCSTDALGFGEVLLTLRFPVFLFHP